MRWNVRTRRIAPSNTGTRVSLGAMRELARHGSQHPDVIAAAHDVVRFVPERNDVASMDAILRGVRDRMRYTADPMNLELVKAPWVSLRGAQQHGVEPMDCDDASVLLSSMLGAVGIPSRFVVVPTDRRSPGNWSHVYVEAQDESGQWHALDPIVRDFDVGDSVPEGELTGPRARFPAALGEQSPSSSRHDVAAEAASAALDGGRRMLKIGGALLALYGLSRLWAARGRIAGRRRR